MVLLLLIFIHFMKALFALTPIMMVTPPRCTSSSPIYSTLSPPCSVLDPIPIHLVLLIPDTLIPYPAISLASGAVCVTSTMVLTFQHLKVVSFLGAAMGPISLWASHQLWQSSSTLGLSYIIHASGQGH